MKTRHIWRRTTGLAKTFLKKDSSEEALSISGEAREEFKGSRAAILQTAITEGIAYKEMNREEDAKKAVDEAARLMGGLSGNIPVEAAMDLAKGCFDLGEKEKGVEFMQNIVKNYHDNYKVIGMVQDVFDDATLQEEGEQIIASTRNEIVELNSKGVHLVEDSKPEEAIEYFKKAASGLPESRIINANAAQALIMYMRENGKSDQHLYQASQYLEKVKKIEDNGESYPDNVLETGIQTSKGVSFITGSTGLGLYFASVIAMLHKNKGREGPIRLSNGGEYGGGCFTITLP